MGDIKIDYSKLPVFFFNPHSSLDIPQSKAITGPEFPDFSANCSNVSQPTLAHPSAYIAIPHKLEAEARECDAARTGFVIVPNDYSS